MVRTIVLGAVAFLAGAGVSVGGVMLFGKGEVDLSTALAADSVGVGSEHGDSLTAAGDGDEIAADHEDAEPKVVPTAAHPPGGPAAVPAAGAAAADANGETDEAALPEPRLGKIFAAMQPREAARVLELMDDRDVATILAMLNDRQAAAVLANLPPQRAAGISRSGLTAAEGE